MAAPLQSAVLSSVVADIFFNRVSKAFRSDAAMGGLGRACSNGMAVHLQITEAGQWRISFGEV